MNKNTSIILSLLIVLIIGAVIVIAYQKSPVGGTESMNNEVQEESSGMRVEENAVVAADQKPGNMVTISQVFLAAPGYVVIHERSGGGVGSIIGSSALLQSGANNQVNVNLNRNVKDGEVLYSMLHMEKDGNTSFSATTDTPILGRSGEPIMMMFNISSTAPDAVEISI